MISVPYLYINIIALICFSLILIVFAAAEKSPPIKTFIVLMADMVIWSGGSILMRLQAFPGVSFWFYVSLTGLFFIAYLCYVFVTSFAGINDSFLKIAWGVGNFLIVLLGLTGLFLKPPVPTALEDGGTVFLYAMDWKAGIPCVFFLGIVFSILAVFRRVIREKGIGTPGVKAIIAGCVSIALGNMIQIIPGNTFPWDALSGVVFAGFLLGAMYKKHMFHLRLLISRSILFAFSGLFCILFAVYFVTPLKKFVMLAFPVGESAAVTMIVVLFIGFLVLVHLLFKKLLDSLFSREEQQSKLLKDFSYEVTQTLNTDEIMEKLVNVIRSEIPVDHIYVCLPEDGEFVSRHSLNPLAPSTFSITGSSPCVTYLREQEPYFILSEFKSSPLYMSVWEEEKALFKALNLGCAAALKDSDEIFGLVLLSGKERGNSFTYAELSFLTTVSSIASIAVKNADLYERMYREARVDSLTGAYNYRYFIEKISEEFSPSKNDSLALIYLDLDDYKLFNQLYGAGEGDRTLRMVAEIISRCVGKNGTVFRNSGKVFAVLLPGYDGRSADALAQEIRGRIEALNETPERKHLKSLTASCGICVSPFAATSARELMENADLAVYNAKTSGKNKVVVFKGVEPVSRRASDRARQIIERTERSGDSAYQINSTTIYALTAAIDAKDHYTYNHSHNVARYASVLATAVGLNPDQVCIIYEAALLHDIGKISVPERILSKEGKLTAEEFAIMKEHVNNSIEMIRHLPAMDYLIPATVGHHERWDGGGYPRGISGEDIPVSARCLAIADAFDAMTTDRPYRKSLSIEYAAEQIENNAGKQFDPKLAKVFVELIRSGEIPGQPT